MPRQRCKVKGRIMTPEVTTIDPKKPEARLTPPFVTPPLPPSLHCDTLLRRTRAERWARLCSVNTTTRRHRPFVKHTSDGEQSQDCCWCWSKTKQTQCLCPVAPQHRGTNWSRDAGPMTSFSPRMLKVEISCWMVSEYGISAKRSISEHPLV